jgi:hypothetical protein
MIDSLKLTHLPQSFGQCLHFIYLIFYLSIYYFISFSFNAFVYLFIRKKLLKPLLKSNQKLNFPCSLGSSVAMLLVQSLPCLEASTSVIISSAETSSILASTGSNATPTSLLASFSTASSVAWPPS